MKKGLLLLLSMSFLLACTPSEEELPTAPLSKSESKAPSRYVENNVLTSDTLPNIKIRVANEFDYVGSFYFEIIAASEEYADSIQGHAVAAGDFVKSDEEKKIEKLFIVQLEGFLPAYGFTYNYNFDSAEQIGNNKYRFNTWFYNSKQQALDNPNNEGAKTRAFLEDKGYTMEDEFMMSRFVGLASQDRKNEIILFYTEMLKGTTGYSLEEYENTVSKEEQQKIEEAFVERSRGSFEVLGK